jgi:hypothetical protein
MESSLARSSSIEEHETRAGQGWSASAYHKQGWFRQVAEQIGPGKLLGSNTCYLLVALLIGSGQDF